MGRYSLLVMSENTNENHSGVLHPSRPLNRELDQHESRSTVASGPNEVGSSPGIFYPCTYSYDISCSVQDEDVTLAKILQEQERAFLELRGVTSLENVPPGDVRFGHEVVEGGHSEGMTDEELAWKLMQEEEHAFQERMMAMAGMGPSSADGGILMEEVEEDAIDPDTLTYEELTTLGEMAGTVAAGLGEEQLKKLHQKQYAEVEGHDDPCVVCQVDFESSDVVIELPCRHVYHPDCIQTWLAAKKTCPHCSQEVV